VFIEEPDAVTGIAIVQGALELAPWVQVARVGRARMDAEELQARLQSAAYLVLPTCADQPMPRPLVEAFANGVPVIASREGSAVDLIEPGRNGLLFQRGEELAAQIRSLFTASGETPQLAALRRGAQESAAQRWPDAWRSAAAKMFLAREVPLPQGEAR